MHGKRTPAWWTTRLQLAIGVVLVLLIGLVGWLTPVPFHFNSITIGPIALPEPTFVWIVALIVAVVGLIWMIRIIRGPSDAPPRWRYRDH